MASTREYLEFILEQLAGLAELSYRPMMGEYILYYKGKIIGGIYDDRLLVKATPAARQLLPDAAEEPPYPGAKPMLPVENVDDRALLEELFRAMEPELPLPQKRGRVTKKEETT